MAVVVLVAFGSPYREFSPGWYGNVGFYLVLTFLFHAFVPILGNLIKYFVVIPASHVLAYYQVRARTSHSIVMQHTLDKNEVGPVFDVTTQSAQMLARLFFAMTFSPGVPLLTLLCCVAFIAHFVSDKFFLCWYHEKPLHLTELVMTRILSFLPYAALLRLLTACWMYSASTAAGDVLSASFDSVAGASQSAGGYNTDVISLASYMKFIAHLQTEQLLPQSADFIYHRVTRGNVFPLFILLLFVITVMVIRKCWYILPFYWLGKGCKHLLKRILKKDRVKVFALKGYTHSYELIQRRDPLRTEAAPFTGPYFRYNVKLTEEPLVALPSLLPKCLKRSAAREALIAIHNGQKQSIKEQLGEDWEETEISEFPVLVKVWPVTALTQDGSTKMKGDHKRTYEVVRDEGSYSYDLEKIAGYGILILAWKEYTADPILAAYYRRHPEKIPLKKKTKKEVERKKKEEEDRVKAALQAEEDNKPREYKHIKRKKQQVAAVNAEEEAAQNTEEEEEEEEETDHHSVENGEESSSGEEEESEEEEEEEEEESSDEEEEGEESSEEEGEEETDEEEEEEEEEV
eukprot:gene26900-33549_t